MFLFIHLFIFVSFYLFSFLSLYLFPDNMAVDNVTVIIYAESTSLQLMIVICPKVLKDGLPYLFRSFRNKYFNKISLGNMLDFQNKL